MSRKLVHHALQRQHVCGRAKGRPSLRPTATWKMDLTNYVYGGYRLNVKEAKTKRQCVSDRV